MKCHCKKEEMNILLLSMSSFCTFQLRKTPIGFCPFKDSSNAMIISWPIQIHSYLTKLMLVTQCPLVSHLQLCPRQIYSYLALSVCENTDAMGQQVSPSRLYEMCWPPKQELPLHLADVVTRRCSREVGHV